MSPEAAHAWHGGRRAGLDAGRRMARAQVRLYLDAHPDAALPWTEEQAFTAGVCVGLSQALDEIDRASADII